MSSRLLKIRSLHTYVMPRTVYFGWICISWFCHRISNSSDKDANKCKELFYSSSGFGDIHEKVSKSARCVFLLLTVVLEGRKIGARCYRLQKNYCLISLKVPVMLQNMSRNLRMSGTYKYLIISKDFPTVAQCNCKKIFFWHLLRLNWSIFRATVSL